MLPKPSPAGAAVFPRSGGCVAGNAPCLETKRGGPLLPTPTVPAVRNNGNARCLMWSRLHSTIHHLAARRTESAHVPLKAGDYLFWVRDERVAKPEHVKHASFALLFRSLLPCQRWPLPEKD